jgi:hypothetical protein
MRELRAAASPRHMARVKSLLILVRRASLDAPRIEFLAQASAAS